MVCAPRGRGVFLLAPSVLRDIAWLCTRAVRTGGALFCANRRRRHRARRRSASPSSYSWSAIGFPTFTGSAAARHDRRALRRLRLRGHHGRGLERLSEPQSRSPTVITCLTARASDAERPLAVHRDPGPARRHAGAAPPAIVSPSEGARRRLGHAHGHRRLELDDRAVRERLLARNASRSTAAPGRVSSPGSPARRAPPPRAPGHRGQHLADLRDRDGLPRTGGSAPETTLLSASTARPPASPSPPRSPARRSSASSTAPAARRLVVGRAARRAATPACPAATPSPCAPPRAGAPTPRRPPARSR